MMLYFPMAITHGPLVHTPSEPNAKTKLEKHTAMVRYTDQLVGRLVATIDKLKLRKNTMIIFTTDNGTSGGSLGTIQGQKPSGGKATKFEGGVCEPFIVSCPGRVPIGIETDALTDFTDLLPTFAELGGAEVPKSLTIDGKSFAPLILGRTEDSSSDWIMALGHGAANLDANGVRGRHDYADRVIRDKQYKIWISPSRKITAFYDLKSDPLEKKNLLGTEQPELLTAFNNLKAIADSLPAKDARPQYRQRQSLPWDKKAEAPKAVKPKRARRRAKKDL